MLLTKKEKDESLTKEATQLRLDFERIMYELGLVNKFKKTYGLYIQAKTNYGYYAKAYLRPGLSFIKLQENVGIVQENLKCLWIMRTEQLQEYAEILIVTKALDKEIPFEDPHIKPWEIYMGMDFSQNVIKINCNDYCHFLLSGATGAGKTRLIYAMITAWVLSCSSNEVGIYIADVIKDGYPKFRWVKHVKYYALSTQELLKVLKCLMIKLEKRKKVMSPLREQGIATNIWEYNKTQKSKMSYNYLIIDEFASIMPDKSDKKEEKEIKEEIIDMLKQFERVGREMGFFILCGVQKTVRDEIPSLIKSQSGVRISFRANDAISSEVIMGDHSAVGLMPRYAVYGLNGGDKNYLFNPKLTTEHLSALLEPYIDRNHKKVDLDAEISAYKEKQPVPAKSTKAVPKSKQKKHAHEVIDISNSYSDDFIKVVGDDFADC